MAKAWPGPSPARCADMPSKNPAQARLMRAAAHNPKFAKKAGVPVKAAKEFVAEDKKRKAKR